MSLHPCLVDSMNICHHKGPLCPPPPCHLPHHKAQSDWGCDDDDGDTEDGTSDSESYYAYEEDEDEGSNNNRNGNAENASQGYSKLSIIGYLAGAVALVSITAAIVFKKRVRL